jgi:uncharacterized protein (DUF4415 family)
MKSKRTAASSQREKLVRRSEDDIRKYAKSSAARDIAKRLRASGSEPSAKDLSDMPALTDDQLRKMYRPLKQPVTVRLDADVVSWLKAKGGRYQTQMNSILRGVMEREGRPRA